MNTTKKNGIAPEIKVTEEEATTLLFHHLEMAAAFFEAGPANFLETLGAFDSRYGEEKDLLGKPSMRKFLENINEEYVNAFDDEAENQASAEGE